MVLNEPTIYVANDRDFFRRTGNQDDPVRSEAFMFASSKVEFLSPALVHQPSSKSESRRTPLTKTEANQIRLPREHLDRKFAAIFSRHRALDGLDDR